MALPAGARLGPYEIQSLVGAGGMGEVYRARDSKLNRTIAIKLLPETTTADPERRARFEREAQSIAALSHPNIVTIYSVEEVEGVLFLTMEYVEGKPLSDVIVKGGLPLTQILNIAIPLADAISAAHEKGITHRDLKPANVMVSTDGRVKVLDFGLAKLREPSPAESVVSALPTAALTGEGCIVGTVAYMAPEQAEGKPVDYRSDIFSLGVLLYELATGQRPFTGDTSVSVLSSIIKDTPRPVTDLRPALPRDLSRIIRHCLVKDPEYRYQSAKDMRNELRELQQDNESGALEASRAGRADTVVPIVGPGRRTTLIVAVGAVVLIAVALIVGRFWLTRTSTASPIDSLAVLPFANVGADPNAEYLSDGITENLINSLSQLPTLHVTARTLAFRYKGPQVDPQQAGRDLHVRAVLTGRVLQRDGALNIQADLINVEDGSQLWGQQYSGRFSDILSLQEKIAREVTEKLRLRPTEQQQKGLAKRGTENTEAYQLYLKGRYYWNRRTELKRAVEYFEQAIDKDPGYALAYAGLADCYAAYSVFEVEPPRQSGLKAKAAATKALEIDNTLAEAHASLAYNKMYSEWDWTGAEREFLRSMELDPNYATAHHWYAIYLGATGRAEQAVASAKRAQQLDPLSLAISGHVGWALYSARRYDEAIEETRKTLEMDPNVALGHWILGLPYEQKAMYPEAIAEFQKALALSRGNPQSRDVGSLGHAYALSGNREKALQALGDLDELSKRRYVSPLDIALIYTGLGDKARALDWLEKAVDDRPHWMLWLKVDPRFDPLRADPRFTRVLRRMGLEP